MATAQILPQDVASLPAVLPNFPSAADSIEAATPDEEFEAWEAERVVFEEYHADKGVRS